MLSSEYTLMRALGQATFSSSRQPRWNEQLLWNILPSSNGSITTLPLDAPLKQWPTKSETYLCSALRGSLM